MLALGGWRGSVASLMPDWSGELEEPEQTPEEMVAVMRGFQRKGPPPQ